jgi:hypothetical protein
MALGHLDFSKWEDRLPPEKSWDDVSLALVGTPCEIEGIRALQVFEWEYGSQRPASGPSTGPRSAVRDRAEPARGRSLTPPAISYLGRDRASGSPPPWAASSLRISGERPITQRYWLAGPIAPE